MSQPVRNCTVCLPSGKAVPAVFVATLQGFQWFECAGHTEHDHGAVFGDPTAGRTLVPIEYMVGRLSRGPEVRDKPKLQVYRSLGESLSVGWERRDVPRLIHVFAQVVPGAAFSVDGHWPCPVCDEHGFSADDFHMQIADALARGPC